MAPLRIVLANFGCILIFSMPWKIHFCRFVSCAPFALKRLPNSSKLRLSMETSHIAELLRPFLGATSLSPRQMEQLSEYLAMLLRWNARTNLTAVRDPESIVIRHFGESLFAARHLLAKDQAEAVVDLGSGAGFPGVPLKIYAPGIALTLIESQNKKATFLKEAIRALKLEGAKVFNGRAEQFGDKADLVTLRAVENFDSTLGIASSLLNRDSSAARLGLLIGEAQVKRAKELLTDFDWDSPISIPLSTARVVLIGSVARRA
jgi:16S rRNA (guanine527-N7)-methyltransferase